MAASTALGILLSSLLTIPHVVLLTGAVLVGLVLLLFARKRLTLWALVLLLGIPCLIGFTRHQIIYANPGSDHLTHHLLYDRPVTIIGTVADWPVVKRYYTEFTLAVDSLVADRSIPVSGGRILLRISDTTTAIQRSDQLLFRGRITRPERYGSFDYPSFLKSRDLHGIVYLPTIHALKIAPAPSVNWYELVAGVRAFLIGAINSTLTPAASALARGFLIGDTRDIPPELYDLFRDTGTLHVLAVSGSNVGLVLMTVALVLGWLSLPRLLFSAIMCGAIVLFCGVAFGEPSVIRASVMAALYIGARLVGRPVDFHNIIGGAALIILSVDPGQLFDVGFQLSFAVSWSLILANQQIVEPLSQRFGWYGWKQGVALGLIGSLVAQLASTPILYAYFDRIPVISLAANLLVIPLVSLATIATLVLIGLFVLWPALAAVIGTFCSFLFDLLIWILRQSTQLQGEPLVFSDVWPGWFKPFFVLVLLTLVGFGLTAVRQRLARRIAVVMTLVLVSGVIVAVWQSGERQPLLGVARHPGGMLVVIRPAHVQPVVIVNGAVSLRSNFVERQIEPLLGEWGVTGSPVWFIRQADAAVIRNLYASATRLAIRTLMVHAPLLPLARQELARHAPPDHLTLVPVTNQTLVMGEDSLFLASDRIVWRSEQVEIHLVAPPGNLAHAVGSRLPAILVTPQLPSQAMQDSGSVELVICATIEQPDEDVSPHELRTTPFPVVDLRREGAVLLYCDRGGKLLPIETPARQVNSR